MPRTVFVHVDRVRASRSVLGVRVDLARPQPADVVRTRTGIVDSSQTELLVLGALRLVEQLLVPLEALVRRPTDNGRDRAPLRRHKLGEVEQLFILFLGPLGLLDRRVEPFHPSCLPGAGGSVPGGAKEDGDRRSTLHCLGVLRTRRDEIRAHWFFPYLDYGRTWSA